MQYDTIIFDLGFTLFTFENFSLTKYFRTLDEGLEQLIRFFQEKKIIRDSQTFRKQFKQIRNSNFQRALTQYKESSTNETLQQTFKSLKLPEISSVLAQQAIMVYHSAEGNFWKPRAGAKSLLKSLHEQQYKIGLLSNAPFHQGIRHLLDTYDLTPFFNIIATSAQIGFCKPDSRTFEFVLEKIASSPQQSVMIGDDLKNDIYGAQQLGMKAILVEKGFKISSNGGSEGLPDHIITDLDEILPILQQWNNAH